METLIIGISGGTCSGKSTLADQLRGALGDRCAHIMHDDYYHPLPDHFRADPQAWNFDHPESLETDTLVEDLQALRAGSPVDIYQYDFATHSRKRDRRRIEPRPVIIVEGILVMAHEKLRRSLDHRVFVHADDDIRLERRIDRDVRERGRTPDEVQERWRRTVHPMHVQFVAPSRGHADLVLDGTRPREELLADVLKLPGIARLLDPA